MRVKVAEKRFPTAKRELLQLTVQSEREYEFLTPDYLLEVIKAENWGLNYADSVAQITKLLKSQILSEQDKDHIQNRIDLIHNRTMTKRKSDKYISSLISDTKRPTTNLL